MSNKEQQLIIVMDREFGSGARRIADLLGVQLQIPVFEKNILQKLGVSHHDDVQDLYYEDNGTSWSVGKKRSKINGEKHEEDNLMEADLAAKEFGMIHRLASAGESFIIIGHCAEEVLRDFDCVVSVFVTADDAFKLERVMQEDESLTVEQAMTKMKRHNWKRQNYHDSYNENKWGYSTNYDLCIASDKLGLAKSAIFILEYLELRFLPQVSYHLNKPKENHHALATLEENVLESEEKIRHQFEQLQHEAMQEEKKE